jgi:glycosyltransferase involved in cell wall biosynthesis
MQQLPDISVLIPSRGRPSKLARCLKSLGTHENVEVLIATDVDDCSEYASVIEGYGQHFIAPRPKTLGVCINELAAKAAGNLLFFLGDDYVIEAPDWPERIMRAARKLPDQVGVLYPRCVSHPGFANLPVISRRTYNALGYYMSPYFPFWFIDTWWEEIGIFLDAKIEIDLDATLPDGKGDTHGLIDISFWASVFDATRIMRVRDAIKLAKLVTNEKDPRFQSFIRALPWREATCAQNVTHLRAPQFIQAWQGRSDAAPSKRYATVKLEAETLMAQLEKERLQPHHQTIQTARPASRNSPCPCGSGKRIKHCHGAA